MNKQDFIDTYYPLAKQAAEKTGIPPLFALAQSALESGWGKHAPGNMLFGMKVGSGNSFGGWQGEKQLLTTTEYASSATASFPNIQPGYPIQLSSGKWKYRIKDYFRAYPSALHAFLDWAGLLSKGTRYRTAMQHNKDPYRFAEEVARAGYATSPTYAGKIKTIMKDLEGRLPKTASSNTTSSNILPIIVLTTGGLLLLIALLSAR